MTIVLNKLFQEISGREAESIVKLTGDGSNRAYYRLTADDTTIIGAAGVSLQENRAFIALAQKFEACGIRAPKVLAVSTDCINWTEVKTVADSREAGKHGVTKLAYSYPDFTYDGDDILILSRTAANAPNNQHDNNMITFFRIKNYKQYRIGD